MSGVELTDEQNEAVAERLRRLKDDLGSQDALAKRLGVRQGLVSMVLSGQRRAGAAIVNGLVAYTGLDRAVIVGDVPETRVEKDGRYAKRAVAVEVTQGEFDPEAVKLVLAYNDRGSEWRPVWWWVEELRRAHDRLLAERENPSLVVVRAERSDRITEEHLEQSDAVARAAEQRAIERKRDRAK